MTDSQWWCPNPFEWLDITAWGHDTVKFSLCIESWAGVACRLAEVPFKQAATMSVDALWNSPEAQHIRHEANRDGIASMCKACPRRACHADPETHKRPASPMPLTSRGPKTLNLAYDRSCNLQCLSCRTHPICHAPGSEMHDVIDAFQENVIRPLLATADRAFLAGLGDPFGSPCYWRLLRTTEPEHAPTLKWYILTNGQGFTPERYAQIPTRRQIDSVQFSIDAATAATYAANRNSNWQKLMENLAFAGQLRSDGKLDKLDISMVVQWNNYKEIPAFIELAKRNHVDTVLFNALLAQGTYKDADYLHRAVHLPHHPEHADAMKIIDIARQATGVSVLVEMPRECK